MAYIAIVPAPPSRWATIIWPLPQRLEGANRSFSQKGRNEKKKPKKKKRKRREKGIRTGPFIIYDPVIHLWEKREIKESGNWKSICLTVLVLKKYFNLCLHPRVKKEHRLYFTDTL